MTSHLTAKGTVALAGMQTDATTDATEMTAVPTIALFHLVVRKTETIGAVGTLPTLLRAVQEVLLVDQVCGVPQFSLHFLTHTDSCTVTREWALHGSCRLWWPRFSREYLKMKRSYVVERDEFLILASVKLLV